MRSTATKQRTLMWFNMFLTQLILVAAIFDIHLVILYQVNIFANNQIQSISSFLPDGIAAFGLQSWTSANFNNSSRFGLETFHLP